MFGKVFRREWHACGSVLLISIAALIALSGLNIGLAYVNADWIIVFRTLFSGCSVLLAVCASVGSMIWLAIRFQNTMFGKSGALVRALPINTNDLYGAKYCAGLLMMVIIGIVSVICIFSAMFSLIFGNIATIAGKDESLRSLLESFSSIFSSIPQYVVTGADIFNGILAGVTMLLEFLMEYALLLFAVSLANVGRAQKNNVLLAVLYYIGFTFGTSIVSGTLSAALPFYYTSSGVIFGYTDLLNNPSYTGGEMNLLTPFLVLALFLTYFLVGRYLADRKCSVK